MAGQLAKSNAKWLYIFYIFYVSSFGDFKASELFSLIFNDLLLVIFCILSWMLSFAQLDQLAVLKMIGIGVIFKLNYMAFSRYPKSFVGILNIVSSLYMNRQICNVH